MAEPIWVVSGGLAFRRGRLEPSNQQLGFVRRDCQLTSDGRSKRDAVVTDGFSHSYRTAITRAREKAAMRTSII